MAEVRVRLVRFTPALLGPELVADKLGLGCVPAGYRDEGGIYEERFEIEKEYGRPFNNGGRIVI